MGLYENMKRRLAGNNPDQSRKYEFTGEQMEYEGAFGTITLNRIRALRDIEGDIEQGIPEIKAGELGGWIEEERNLSHEGKSWVADEAKVFEVSYVLDNARVEDEAVVYNSTVTKNAKIFENARVDDSFISANAKVHGHSKVIANSHVSDDAEVKDGAEISFGAQVYGHTKICQGAQVQWNSKVYGDVVIDEGAVVKGESEIYGNAKVSGDAIVTGKSEIFGDALIGGEAIVAGGSKINHGTIADNVIISGGIKVCDLYPEEKTVGKENDTKEQHTNEISGQSNNTLGEQQTHGIKWVQEDGGGLHPDFSFEFQGKENYTLEGQQQVEEIDIEP